MKSFLFTIVLGVIWTVARFGSLSTAQAVVPELARAVPEPSASLNDATASLKAGPTAEPDSGTTESSVAQRVEIPIAWQRTKARIVGKGTSTLTESFREIWTLELRPGGYLFLESPRARVAVFPATGSESRQVLPRSIVLAESDFARLVGVIASKPGEIDSDVADVPAIASRPLTLNLAKTDRGGTDITLAWSDDEHYAIHLDIASTALF